jgi:hypothetical protein
MAQVPAMGTKLDAQRRKDLLRHDDEDRRRKISRSREFIFKDGRNVNSENVENLLKDHSLTPTRVSDLDNRAHIADLLPTIDIQNAFSDFSSQLPEPPVKSKDDSRFFMFRMLAVDFMHEWELGVWKAVLIHLIRLVTAHGTSYVRDLDYRYVLHSMKTIIDTIYIYIYMQLQVDPSIRQRHNPSISF